MSLTPVTRGAGPSIILQPSAVTTLFASSRKLIFQIPSAPLVAPNSAIPGQTLQVAITTSTPVLTGSTTASFGNGISVGGAAPGAPGPLLVTSPTTAIAQLAIDPAGASGPRTVSIGSSTQQLGFVVLTGSNDPVYSGPGINVASPTAYLVSVSGQTTSGATFTSGNSAAITVLPAARIVSVSPSSAMPGQTTAVTITGQYTNFVQGSTQASFGPGISVGGASPGQFGPVTVLTSTTALARLTLDASAAVGARYVTVQTGVQQAILPNGFQAVTDWLLYVANVESNTVSVIDTNTDQVTGTIQVADHPEEIAVTPDGSHAYVASGTFCTPGVVSVIDTQTNAVTDTITAGLGTFTRGIAITPDGTRAYVSNVCSNSVSVINTATDQVVATIGGLNFPLGIVFSLDGTRAYVAVGGSTSSGPSAISVIDTSTNTVLTTIGVGPQPHNLALTPDGTRLYVANESDGQSTGSITVIDATTNAITATIPSSGAGTGWPAVTPNGIQVYVSNRDSNSVTVIDASSNTITATVPVGIEPNGVVVRPDGTRVYVASNSTADPSSNGVSVIGTSNRSVVDTVVLPAGIGAFGLAIVPVITAPTSIQSIIPNSATEGQTVSVAITGQNTHFVQGTTSATFGTGVLVASLTVVSATSATAVLNIDPAATLGSRTVTLTTGTEVDSLANGFTLLPAPPTNQPPVVSAGSPQSIYLAGRVVVGHDVNTLSSSIAGPNEDQFAINVAQWLTGAKSGNILAVESSPSDATRDYAPSVKTALHGAGFVVTYVSDPTTVSALTLANLQPYNAVFVGETFPVITSINPSVLLQYLNGGGNVYVYGGVGELAVVEAGLFNPFLEALGLSFATTGPDGEYNGLNSVNITSTHPIFNGLTGKTLACGNGQDILALGTNVNATIIQFQGQNGVYAVVNPHAALLSLTGSISDDGLPTGATLTAAWAEINGPGPVRFSNPDATFPDVAGQVNPVSTSATFTSPGTYILNLAASDSQLSSSANVSITVLQTGLRLNSVNPVSGEQSQQHLSVTITGQYTNFVQGTTTATFGTGITVASLTVTSAISATAVLNIDPAAALGSRTVTLTTGTEVDSLANGFTVVAAVAPPSISSISPNSGQQGQQNLSVTITGQNTHFVQGTTSANFGAGITVASLTVNSATSATAIISIDALATIGPRDVSLATGKEVAALSAGFTVSSGIPALISVSPTTGRQGQVLTATITGQFTNFSAGSTQASFGDGISVGGAMSGAPGPVTVIGPTIATAQLAIAGAPLWAQLSTSATVPTPRAAQLAVYAQPSNQMIVFGGQSLPQIFNDVWILNNANGIGASSWTQVTPQGTPPSPRWYSTGAYDPNSDRMIVFGGLLSTPNPCSDETWVLANATARTGPPTWIQLQTVGAVPASKPDAVYDTANNRLIVVDEGCGGLGNDVWVLSNANGLGGTPTWTQLNPTGTPPPPREAAPTAYDPESNRMILFGGNVAMTPGFVDNDVWILTNANGLGGAPSWIQLSPSGTPPAARGNAGSIYDAATNAMLVYGGHSSLSGCFYGDAWRLSNANGLGGTPIWQQVLAFGPQPYVSDAEDDLMYDPSTDRMITLGGYSVPTFTTGLANTYTWVLSSAVHSSNVGSRTISVQMGTTSLSLPAGFTVVPPPGPPLLLVNPTCGAQGQTLPITIFGSNTNFVQGSTQAIFGPGISTGGGTPGSAGPVSVANSTLATAELSIDSAAPLTLRDVAVQTGSEGAILPNGFAVRTPLNLSLQSVQPNSGLTGQTLSVSIVGQSTNFVQGTTQVSLGDGIIINSVTVADPSDLTVQITISTNAAPGPRTVTLTTGSEVVQLLNGFTIQGSAPAITVVSPNSGPQGGSGPVGITGQNTHFVQGTTQVDFGAGITVSNINVGCDTCLTATLSIDPAAIPGPRTVTITTGAEVVALPNGFTVLTPTITPILTSIVPTNVQQGQSVGITITGNYTHFTQGTTQVSFGAGVTVASVTVNNPGSLIAQIVVDPSAPTVARPVTVTTGGEVVSSPSVFNVNAATATLYSLNPGGGSQGQQNLSVSITGLATHFVQGTSVAIFGAGVTVTALTVSSATTATAIVSIDPAAAPGQRTVTVTTSSEVASFANGFTVSASGPILYTLNPGGSSQGATNLQVQITGLNTHFNQGASVASFGAGITVVSLTVTSPTAANAVIDIDPTATIGQRTVTVTTGSEAAPFANGFSVVAGVAGITEINPGGGLQGTQNLSLAITAQFTHWVQGTTQASFGAGVTVVSLTITSATTATAVVNVDPAASLGARDVTFTSGTEVVTAPGGFTINAGFPSITQVTPTSGQQGQQNLSVAITGQFTHFTQGTTTASFGNGITVASLVVNSATSATATLNIDAAAATGPRSVTLTTGAEVASLSNGFTVTASTPTLVSVNPNSAPISGANLPVTITGAFTHFVQGTTVADFGAGIFVVALSVNSATSASVVLNISSSAVSGARTVTVTTGSEIVSLPNGFTVQPAGPSTLAINPSSGLESQTLSVVITGQGSHFVQGTTVARFGPGVMVGAGLVGDFGPVTVTSPTTATAQLSILKAALPAPRTVTVQTGDEVLSSANAFSVVGSPYLFSAIPSFANRGQSVSITLNGAFTNFVPGTTQVSFGPGVSVGGAGSGGFGPVTVNSATSVTAQIAVDPAASLGLRTVIAQTGAQQASSADVFSVLGPITGPGPQVSISSPMETTQVTAPTAVTGTATSPNLDYWKLEYQAATASNFIQFATGTTSTVAGTFDPTSLLNGNAIIRLTAVDTSGQTASTTVTVVLTRNLKIGNFTVSFNDLSVPVAGLPIQIVRTYDSRFKGIGDFGVGWRLDLDTVQIAENIPLSDQWTNTVSGGLFASYCVQQLQTHALTVTLADGTTYEFQPALVSNGCQQFQPPTFVTVNFVPTGTTPPNAVLTVDGSNEAYPSGSFPGNSMLLESDLVTPFDPDQYLLTLPDGRILQISMSQGLQKMTDLNGNTLMITPTGITSSTGKSVSFQRDSQNRIQTITDPNGNMLNYSYNTAGDLVSFVDASQNASTYTYDANHDLLTIVDPAGVQPIRNDYDANGLLVSHTDAYGNVINYTNDPGLNQEVVTDRNGNVTVNEYDSAGNITKVTDQLGGITMRTYDVNGNVKTETNALGFTTTYTYDVNNNKLSETDPLGHETDYTYNSRNQALTIKDANGHLTTNVYDNNGNLQSTTDAAGNVTGYTYNTAGLRISMKDPLNNVTQYEYDSSGNLIRQTDPLSHVTAYTYDNNGNKTRQTTTRTVNGTTQTLVTSYQYDNSNRLTQTTYPDSSTTQVQYNSIGKQSVTIDQLGHQTSYQYDLMGRLLQTSYPDGTSESSTYDPNGNRVTSVDRAQRTTTYVYDALSRLTKTVYPDSTATSTTYDLIGEVTAVTDALGNATQYKYDSAGRRTQAIDALGHSTTFQYDGVGNQIASTDANGNATQYQYDNLNRRIKTTYPDSTTDSIAYDPLGRTISKTDQANLSTQYQYDDLGRLIQVTDATGQLTKYSYDEVGNRISQTDANGHTTSLAYDELGRRTQRTLPAGQSETTTYDAAGNQKTHADFNGKTTIYTYDVDNRLTSKTPDPSFNAPAVSFTYTATSQRLSMVDISGTTQYQYDLRDRLTQKATPEGTLAYTYDLGGNLKSIQSSNPTGTNVNYHYDADNRLSLVKDNRLAAGTTSYSYDSVGNLQGYVYPNIVQTSYIYNSSNRLTNLSIANGSATTIASYAYLLGPAGNRTHVTELSGRQVTYGYDNLYRLTSETITGDPNGKNGAIGYQYDPVGNRLNRTSTVGPVPPATYSYDADDRLTADTYDANGSTTASGGNSYTYDFENHLTNLNSGQATYIYDGDGNRVAKTASGVITQYLVDDRNLTGYAQVLEEISGGTVQRVYTYGLNRISQSQASGTSFYRYDGHGSVRLLTDTTGTVTDQFDYDAFGNIIIQTGTTPNVYLYSGEQNDPNLGFYYLRARYFSTSRGRFLTQDSVRPNPQEPMSINRFMFAFDRPTDLADPSGLWPTDTHNFILESAFELFLPPDDIRTLEQVSADQDSLWLGGQDWTRSYQHHMRDGHNNQPEGAAQNQYQQFIDSNLQNAKAAQASGDHKKALMLLGQNFHALADGTSPAHSCLAAQMYDDLDKAPECANSNEAFRPWELTIALWHPVEEADREDFGVGAAIDIVRNHYLQNFQHSGLSFLPARPVISIESLDAFPELGSILVTATFR